MFIENSWTESYPTGRIQFCAINGVESTLNLVERGVPQGNILGPLLLLVFINDLSGPTSFSTLLCTPTRLVLYLFQRKLVN